MDKFNDLKNKLSAIASDTRSLIRETESNTKLRGDNFQTWGQTCQNILDQIPEGTIRVAVVGPIKSGKSTLVNSMFKGDYLKRGAGVVTSIVTRIRRGKELKASIRFKSWEEINNEIEGALVLLPSFINNADNEKFDIRRKTDRSALGRALNALDSGKLITDNARNINSILLSSYLKGFDRIKALDFPRDMKIEYKGEDFPLHKPFVSDDTLSVYLKDILLYIDSGPGNGSIEIADCQGSDSPNPLHLAMIQDYLLTANLLVYVVSSRTGLRQADIRFLSIIKEMGIMDNIVFVVNCDFSEHDDLDGLRDLVRKVKDEISMLKPSPTIFTFSALYCLFKATRSDNLADKDKARLDQWEMDMELTNFSNGQKSGFESILGAKLNKEKYSLLLHNNLERLKIVISNINNWAAINRDILSGDKKRAENIIRKLQNHQDKMRNLKAMIKRTLDGSIHQLTSKLKKDVDNFFDPGYGQVADDLKQTIKSFKVSHETYRESIASSGFNQALFMAFQEFKQMLDTHMAESVNPKIIGFIKTRETKIKDFFDAAVSPYLSLVEEAIDEYKSEMENFGINLNGARKEAVKGLEIETIKKISHLNIPPATNMMNYSAKIKTEAVMRFGFYAVLNLFRKLLRKPSSSKSDDAIQALHHGVLRMKRETSKSLAFHFKSYKENIKFQYLFKLAEAVSNVVYETLIERFQSNISDLAELTSLMDEKKTDRANIYCSLDKTIKESTMIMDRIADLGTETI